MPTDPVLGSGSKIKYMENTIKRPIKRSLIAGCVLFVAVLILVLFVVNYSGYKQTLYRNYENFISVTLNHTAENIDVDDLRDCIDSNRESEKYHRLQNFMDDLKENMDLEYLYVIVPLNTQDEDNIKNVIAGMSKEEYADESIKPAKLNSLTGTSYSASTAKKYLDAFRSGKLTFFEESAEWGDEYTGMMPLYDSNGQKVAALCLDIDIHSIHTQLNTQTFYIVLATIIIGLLFTFLFIFWTRKNISHPIQELERVVTTFAQKSHLRKAPEELVLEVPEINTENELQSLSNAVVKMSEDIRDYAKDIADAEEESKNQAIALSEALAAAQDANQAKTAFLSNMSHEIRTPLNAIIGLDSIALTDPDLSSSTRDQLEKINSSAQHLLTIINDILDMSRIESGRLTLRTVLFTLSRTLDQVNTIIAGQCRDKSIDYTYSVIGEPGDYYLGDDMKLRQILINILGNAVKFTPSGGTIEFTVECIAHFDAHSTLRFTIRDTGVGMSEEFIPHIFDSFSQEDPNTTTRYGTTGLGMAITKSLVDLMAGEISVESEKGSGSTFTVTLTLREPDRPPVTDAADAPTAPQVDLSGRRILVAEDVAINAEIIRMLLETQGMIVDVAEDGAIAVEQFTMQPEGTYSAILMDMRMPVMDGIRATQAIRSLPRSDAATITIIALTANAFDEDVQRSLQAGLNAHLSKPVEPQSLFDTLQTLIKD